MVANRKLKRGQRGVTLIELMVAIVASSIVLFALGNIVLANQKAMKRSENRASMQGHTTVIMAQMARAIRGANSIEIIGANAFRLRDLSGSVTHTYQLVTNNDGPRLQQDGVAMAEMNCTRFTVTTNTDTTNVTLDLELTSPEGVVLNELNTVAIRNRTLKY